MSLAVANGVGAGWPLSLLTSAGVAAGVAAGPEAVAESLADTDLRMRRRELRRELHRLPREEQYRVVHHFNHHPDPDTNQIVSPLIDELRAAFPELAPAPAPEGQGDEPAPR